MTADLSTLALDQTGRRVEDLRIEVISADERELDADWEGEPPRILDTVNPTLKLKGGWLDDIAKGGTLDLDDPGDIEWGSVKIRLTYLTLTPGGWQEYPLGIWFPTTPKGERSEGQRRRTVELYDLTLAMHEDAVAETFSVQPGQNVVETVRELVLSCGLREPVIPESEASVRVASSWEPGTTKLRIAQDLLNSILYTRLTMNWDGLLTSERQLTAGEESSYEPVWILSDDSADPAGVPYFSSFSDEVDLFSVPNRWIGFTRSEGETLSLYSVADNDDPESPTSYQARGRWVVRVTTDVEANTQETLDAIIQGNLTRATNATREVGVKHPFYPFDLRELITFINQDHGVAIVGRLTHFDWDFSLPGVSCSTTLRETRKL